MKAIIITYRMLCISFCTLNGSQNFSNCNCKFFLSLNNNLRPLNKISIYISTVFPPKHSSRWLINNIIPHRTSLPVAPAFPIWPSHLPLPQAIPILFLKYWNITLHYIMGQGSPLILFVVKAQMQLATEHSTHNYFSKEAPAPTKKFLVLASPHPEQL